MIELAGSLSQCLCAHCVVCPFIRFKIAVCCFVFFLCRFYSPIAHKTHTITPDHFFERQRKRHNRFIDKNRSVTPTQISLKFQQKLNDDISHTSMFSVQLVRTTNTMKRMYKRNNNTVLFVAFTRYALCIEHCFLQQTMSQR